MSEQGSIGLNTKATLQRIADARLFAIVRTKTADEALWAANHLIRAGFSGIEVPLTVPDAARVIETLVMQFPDALIGAGTVMDETQGQAVLKAGARFIVSPVLVESLIQLGLESDVLTLPGCLTPTEIVRAYQLGAPAIKLFPVQTAGGPEYLKAIRGPLPEIPIIPTGGIGLNDVAGYLKAGAVAVGVGGPLLSEEILKTRDETWLTELARSYLQQVSPA